MQRVRFNVVSVVGARVCVWVYVLGEAIGGYMSVGGGVGCRGWV